MSRAERFPRERGSSSGWTALSAPRRRRTALNSGPTPSTLSERSSGLVLRPGAEIRGHVDKIGGAHQAGRARIWLAFDDISTPRDRCLWSLSFPRCLAFPPFAPSTTAKAKLKTGPANGRTTWKRPPPERSWASSRSSEHNSKGAAIGAATGAVTAFMIASELGQEVTLERNTKPSWCSTIRCIWTRLTGIPIQDRPFKRPVPAQRPPFLVQSSDGKARLARRIRGSGAAWRSRFTRYSGFCWSLRASSR